MAESERYDFDELIDGVDWTPQLTPLDADGAVVDPSTYTPTLTIFDRFGGTAVRTLTRDNGITSDFANGGEFPRVVGSEIPSLPERGAFDFRLTLLDGTVREYLHGYIVRSVR